MPRNPELENTGQFNVYGIPAISVPCGFTSAGLPVGLMIAGPRFAEGRVLALAHAFEQATEWHTKRPPLTPDTPVPPLAKTTALAASGSRLRLVDHASSRRCQQGASVLLAASR